MKNVLLAVLLLIPISSIAGETPLSDLINATYDFRPHELTGEEMDEKSKSLDNFWNNVLSNRDEYLPILRNELSSTGRKPFFYLNAGLLLLQASDLDSDRVLFLNNVTKANLADVDNTYYLRLIYDLGKNGFDTSDAALHLLSYPDFQAFIPEHALSLGIGWSLNVLLIPIKEDLFLQKVIDKLRADKGNPQIIHLTFVLWHADSPGALSVLQDISEDSSYSEEIRTTAKKLIAVDSTILQDLDEATTKEMYESLGISSELTYSQLKEFRKKTFTSISDESLGRYKTVNSLMKRKRISANR